MRSVFDESSRAQDLGLGIPDPRVAVPSANGFRELEDIARVVEIQVTVPVRSRVRHGQRRPFEGTEGVADLSNFAKSAADFLKLIWK